MPKFCNNCGAPVNVGTEFCPSCDNPVSQPVQKVSCSKNCGKKVNTKVEANNVPVQNAEPLESFDYEGSRVRLCNDGFSWFSAFSFM